MAIEAVLVNTNTNIVEGIIAVNSLDDVVPEGYILLPVPIEQVFKNEEEKELYLILKEIDSDFENPDICSKPRLIHPWSTKWSLEQGFYD